MFNNIWLYATRNANVIVDFVQWTTTPTFARNTLLYLCVSNLVGGFFLGLLSPLHADGT